MYAWIGINFVLGRFDHADEGEFEVDHKSGTNTNASNAVLCCEKKPDEKNRFNMMLEDGEMFYAHV